MVRHGRPILFLTNINQKKSPEGVHIIWDVIPCFNQFVCGDLCFFFTILGRLGHDTCKCPYYTLTATHWKLNPSPVGEVITLDTLKSALITKTYGVKTTPQWQHVKPAHYIAPLLHMEMGLINLVLKSLRGREMWYGRGAEQINCVNKTRYKKLWANL